MNFILASGSPRRKEILSSLNQQFTVVTSLSDELKRSDLSPEQNALLLAINKAEEVFSRTGMAALGADTVVALNGVIYGKPKDREDAVKILKTLSGKEHLVITGVAVADGNGTVSGYEVSRVKIKDLTISDIENYIDSFNVYDKAGAYAIQDGVVVKSFEGSYSNIVGLPKTLTERLLKEKGLWQEES